MSQSYLKELNEVQRLAVTTIDGPIMVVAGPGSGKTRVLTYRIAHLLNQGIRPWEILALTFTNKAAKEMKERIQKVVGDIGIKVQAGTFHSVFARILRSEADKLGYPSNFTIYDTEDAKSVISGIVKEMNLPKDSYNPATVLSRISSAKSNLIPPKAYRENPELMQQDIAGKRPHIVDIYEKYLAKCKRAGAMDFDDLLYQFYVLLHKNQDNVLGKYQQKFKYLLVDEFQDTNFLQYSIVKKLTLYTGSPCNVCIVGDDAQSIYAFRGATIENILDFEKDFKNLKVFKLEQNYRSTQHIVEAANEVISYNRRQIQKSIWTSKDGGQRIRVVKAISDIEEGKQVADIIMEQKNRYHLRNNEIAILYRTNAQSRSLEEALRRNNLSYRVFGGLSFYQRKEVKDLIAYLRLATNPNDEEALKRVINYPRRGIGNTTIDKLSAMATALDKTMWECLDLYTGTAREVSNFSNFALTIKAFQQEAAKKNAFDAARLIFKRSGLEDELKSDLSVEGLGRMENVQSLLNGIGEFVTNDEITIGIDEIMDKSLSTYLQHIALVTDADKASNDDDKITLMSVHAAKGLEFKSVFVVGMEDNIFPSYLSMSSPEQLDEERRLFYVAITRAEQFLTLTFANTRYNRGDIRKNEPSRFLREINSAHLESTGSAIPRNTRANTISEEIPRSSVSGNFRPATFKPKTQIAPADFKACVPSELAVGMSVLHLKFGQGKVINIDGAKENPVATIDFPDIPSPTERRIALNYSKLQILD